MRLFFTGNMSCRGDASTKIVAVDLQTMAPLAGVIQLQGDITKVNRISSPHTFLHLSSCVRLIVFPALYLDPCIHGLMALWSIGIDSQRYHCTLWGRKGWSRHQWWRTRRCVRERERWIRKLSVMQCMFEYTRLWWDVCVVMRPLVYVLIYTLSSRPIMTRSIDCAVTGLHDIDEYIQAQLLLAVGNVCIYLI